MAWGFGSKLFGLLGASLGFRSESSNYAHACVWVCAFTYRDIEEMCG